MPDKGNNRKAPVSTGRIVLGHAADIATLGDRWFLSLASGFGMLGGRTRRAAGAASESRLRGPERESVRGPESESVRRPESESVDSEPGSGAQGQRFDVVSANHADAWSPLASGPRVRDDGEDSEECRGERPPDGATHRPGVLPLLQALARVVAEHSGDDYAGLADDERFWTLIRLLQALGVPGDGAGDEDMQEEEPPRQQTRRP